MFTFRKYNEIPIVLQAVDKEFSKLHGDIYSSLSQFTGNFETLVKNFTQALETPLFQTQKGKKLDNIHSKVFKNFAKLSEVPILNIAAYSQTKNLLTEFLQTYVADKAADYHVKSANLVQKFEGQLQILEDAKSRYEAAYSQYNDQGFLFQQSGKGDRAIVEEGKRALREKRIIAKNAHEVYVGELDVINDSMESLMTDFEALEISRIKQLKDLLTNLAHVLRRVALVINEHPIQLKDAIQRIDFKADYNLIKPPPSFRAPLSDDSNRIGSVPTSISLILTPVDLFPDDIAAKKTILVATKDFEPAYGELSTISGEFLVLLEEDGERLKVKNVNGSVGFLPANIVEKFQTS